jgi:hypothetical protein
MYVSGSEYIFTSVVNKKVLCFHRLLRRGACFAVAWGGLLGDALKRRVPAHHAITPPC